jgi:hypothetical protein
MEFLVCERILNMLQRVLVTSIVLFLLHVSTATAAPPLQAKPWVFDPDNTGICDSAWVAKTGLPDGKGNANHGLLLTKEGPTPTNAASGASINFAGELTELGFDVRNDGWCGAGAPRFNVYTASGTYYFFGCASGVHTPVPGNPDWTRVRFLVAATPDGDGFPVGPTTATDFDNVTGIDIVFDEGTDIPGNPGYTVLDNIDINGTLIGKPGAAK